MEVRSRLRGIFFVGSIICLGASLAQIHRASGEQAQAASSPAEEKLIPLGSVLQPSWDGLKQENFQKNNPHQNLTQAARSLLPQLKELAQAQFNLRELSHTKLLSLCLGSGSFVKKTNPTCRAFSVYFSKAQEFESRRLERQPASSLVATPNRTFKTVHLGLDPYLAQPLARSFLWQEFLSLPFSQSTKLIRNSRSPESHEWTAEQMIRTVPCIDTRLQLQVGLKLEENFDRIHEPSLLPILYKHIGACLSNQDSKNDISYQYYLRSAIFFSYLQDNRSALDVLLKITSKVPYTAQPRFLFWKRETQLKLGMRKEAEETEVKLLTDYPLSFYSAYIRHHNHDSFRAVPQDTSVAYRSGYPALDGDLRLVETLIQMKEEKAAEVLLISTMESARGLASNRFLLYLSTLFSRMGVHRKTFVLATEFLQKDSQLLSITALKLVFPLLHFDVISQNAQGLDPLLLASLIKQESSFQIQAKSKVGARGLMQIMPATARMVAGRKSVSTLHNPTKNVRLGARYLHQLLQRLNHKLEPTLAAYNAGFGRVVNWKKRYPLASPVLFLELIPFAETRDYVPSIVRNYYWYQRLYGSGSRTPASLIAARNESPTLAIAAAQQRSNLKNKEQPFQNASRISPESTTIAVSVETLP